MTDEALLNELSAVDGLYMERAENSAYLSKEGKARFEVGIFNGMRFTTFETETLRSALAIFISGVPNRTFE